MQFWLHLVVEGKHSPLPGPQSDEDTRVLPGVSALVNQALG